jgi:hypothetical protein
LYWTFDLIVSPEVKTLQSNFSVNVFDLTPTEVTAFEVEHLLFALIRSDLLILLGQF